MRRLPAMTAANAADTLDTPKATSYENCSTRIPARMGALSSGTLNVLMNPR